MPDAEGPGIRAPNRCSAVSMVPGRVGTTIAVIFASTPAIGSHSSASAYIWCGHVQGMVMAVRLNGRPLNSESAKQTVCLRTVTGEHCDLGQGT